MMNQLSWKVGGQQGEGIESTGEIFAVALKRMGYHLYGYRHFSSRIKGGHTNNKIRVSTRPTRAISDDLDVLVAFDQETIDLNIHELAEHGIVIADSKFNPKLPEGANGTLYAVPFTQIADELGSSLMKNMVAVGASASALGINIDAFHDVVREIFKRKGDKIIDMNIQALNKGYDVFMEQAGGELESLRLEQADGKKRMFMIGNDAIALGAIAAGCRLMAAYPITPASEIMEYLIKKLPEFGGTVVQTEDEIAAITMAIGANFGGVRALTASAGPGLSLMMEGIGLAGMTETPVVIVDTQRGGPSTGLPTKQEQSDINALIHGTHGEIPKVVIAPSTAEEAFYDTVEAFNIAEELQCPVIIASDLQLSLGKQTVDPLDYSRVEIRRGKLLDEVPEQGDELFKRFEITDDGISPRVLPGTKNGLIHATGVEHGENGRPSEDAVNRKLQMDKRLRKLSNLKFYKPLTFDAKYEDPDILVLGMGSTVGTITEAKERLEAEGHKVNHVHVRLLHPFPTDELKPYIESAKQVLVVENNATGQLANLVRLNVGYAEKIRQLNKYDGNPFLPHEIEKGLKELL
ncbi:2-oxoglutarate ferredoxin oxidoreductase subunit alpha [Caldalkalibacillus uzonensis]|uniref:2-oxoglutarate ferredoxin oxidoreductase subunit alpha n=1 Tax=Caldalkalibacillus uzonensis TaxID=353224 RepID=A0ABU0CQP5_9BACI|nr:2-oxoacid:acceptor oxidoreductase subunit alpha [Caldalkalibacillus uzonensis]MDQ0337337.1 2-oxoglutarate ferredoxin oxidoreductase subunit alpha [Caldalkalibacillus uzonensis]